MNKNLEEAVRVLNTGGILIFPTDTAFGVGCRIDMEQSVKRLLKLRKRPEDMAVPILVNSIEMAQEYGTFSEDLILDLVKPNWPGALTVVTKAKKNMVPSMVRGGKDTVGIRMPNNNNILEIINRMGVPLLGPSANFHGDKTPYSLFDLNPNLKELVDYVLDGSCDLKKSSTVVDTTIYPWKILRQGLVKVRID